MAKGGNRKNTSTAGGALTASQINQALDHAQQVLDDARGVVRNPPAGSNPAKVSKVEQSINELNTAINQLRDFFNRGSDSKLVKMANTMVDNSVDNVVDSVEEMNKG